MGNKFCDLKNTITVLYENFVLYTDRGNLTTERGKMETAEIKLDKLHDTIVDIIGDALFRCGCGLGMWDKFSRYNDKWYYETLAWVHHERYTKNNGFMLTLEIEMDFGVVARKVIGYMDDKSAKTYYKRFFRKNKHSNICCCIYSRNYCTNWVSFCNDINPETVLYNM